MSFVFMYRSSYRSPSLGTSRAIPAFPGVSLRVVLSGQWTVEDALSYVSLSHRPAFWLRSDEDSASLDPEEHGSV